MHVQKELSADGQEVRLYCHSVGRETKETAMAKRFCSGFEAGLQTLSDGLQKPRCEKRYDKILERIGRLQEKSRGASQHYTVTLNPDVTGKTATGLTWEKSLKPGAMATHPGLLIGVASTAA